MLGSADMQIYGDPYVAQKGKSGFVYSFFSSKLRVTAPVGRSVCTDCVHFLSNNVTFRLTIITTKSFSL